MFGSLGVPELIFIFALALLIFGPRKLPEIGRTIGRGLAEFRKASTDLKRSINAEMIEDELRQSDPRNVMREPSAKEEARDESPVSAAGVDAEDTAPDASTSDTASEPVDVASPVGSVPRSGAGASSSAEASVGESPAGKAPADSEAP